MITSSQCILHVLQKQWFFVREASQIAYGDDFAQVPDEKDLLRAHLVVELIERYHYPPQAIGVGVYVPLWRKGMPYAELDIVVHNKKHNPYIIATVELPERYQADQTDAMQKLFATASFMRQKPEYLVYYTRWYEKQGQEAIRKTRQFVVCYSQYPTYSAWHVAGRPTLSDMPQNAP